jgi:acylphosphatase
MNRNPTRRLLIHGRVQGVWYRGWAIDTARSLGVDGWVRNRRDGSVELLASGPEPMLASLIARCREGPPAARVDRIEIEDSDEAVPTGFAGLPTA